MSDDGECSGAWDGKCTVFFTSSRWRRRHSREGQEMVMVTRVTRPRVLVGVSTLLMAVSACGSPQACGGVGVVAKVGVYFAQESYGDLAGASVRLCANGRCVEHRLRNETVSSITLRLPDDIGPDLGTVRFQVTRKGGNEPLIDASAEKKLTFQSDECGGGVYNEGLAFTKENGLTAKIPKSVSAAWHKQVMERATAEPASSESS
ncbi:hypothetical protein [Streptomyces canus]|uniref:hypothetical protein n=1 Tax=Streptomyces canus TaxID=58343 RepID=UPI0036E9EB15